MTYALICRDKAGALEIRKANREAHLDYIAQTGVVRIAGPFLDDDGQMSGSLVVLDVQTKEQAETWAQNDPYAKAGLFDSVSIQAWKQVIG
ncbi:YciI-like protein [Aquimixticola soesokkakensis]|uniref:YciI-like protein n=1 Tax=Aquimixticola soesokkakensis TaxID=1519096 RepID=A0A1Y5R9Z1_9RHOB|nr:YciI family protein [Aquimixticola soesokkakensis]SLN12231.1 YciI-like protein [Aquimixticola soesokkakensis]